MLKSLIIFARKNKEALTIAGSAFAVAISIYTYISQNFWHVHDLEIYVQGDVQDDLEELPVHVIAVNRGKRNEIIVSVVMALQKQLLNGNTEVMSTEFSPVPVVVETSSARSFELPGTKQYINDLNKTLIQLPGNSSRWAPKGAPIAYGAYIRYVAPNGKISSKFMEIGTVIFMEATTKFESPSTWGDTSKPLF